MLITKLPDPHLFEDNSSANSFKNAVIYASTDSNYHYPKHLTPYLLVANFKGTGHYRINDMPAHITNKFFYFLNAGTELEINFKDNAHLETMLILFNAQLINEAAYYQMQPQEILLEDYHSSHSDNFYIPQIPFEYNAAIMHDINKLKSSNDTEQQENTLINLISNLCQTKEKTKKDLEKLAVKRKATREELHKRLLFAKLFMHDNFTSNLTIDGIAYEACLNKFHFLKLFKQYYNVSPHQYIVKLKLDHALTLLKSGKMSVFEVCQSIGFESQGTFTNLFKRYYGFLPSKLQIPNNE